MATWTGVALGLWGVPVGVAAAVWGWRTGRRALGALLAVVIGLAAIAGLLEAAQQRAVLESPLPAGRVRLFVEFRTDADAGGRSTAEPRAIFGDGRWIEWRGPPLLVFDRPGTIAGTYQAVEGRLRSRPGLYRGAPVAAALDIDRDLTPAESAGVLHVTGNMLRDRVQATLGEPNPGRALLAGFLIGDTTSVPPADVEALRKAGLSHFVAVSGSNVALFLAGWWLVTAPLALDPRLRAATGLVGLALFVVVTRAEPSVLRAAVMAGTLLLGRAANIPVDTWTALGGATTLLLLAEPALAGNAGFQLSVAATAGVLVGLAVAHGRTPRWLWMALAGTMGAQAAVAPLLLWHFGTVPLLAPVTNLLAAPLVSLATAVAGIAVVAGLEPLVGVAAVPADLVLAIARLGAGWPQAGRVEALIAAVGVAGLLRRGVRPLAVAFVIGSLLVASPGSASRPHPGVVFLDVGQGDAAIVFGPAGEVIVVDGGPDQRRFHEALDRYGVDGIDLLVVSHRHADHVTGLSGLIERVRVGELWHPPHRDVGDVLGAVIAAARMRHVPVATPEPGWRGYIGGVHVEVLGPRRRYASPNDESLVVRIDAGGPAVLFPGDVERFAQRDLGTAAADILKVPHQGAATSNPNWLADTGAVIAVVSVGPNNFGHPDGDILAGLSDAGMVVYRTDRDGDVVIPLISQGESVPADD